MRIPPARRKISRGLEAFALPEVLDKNFGRESGPGGHSDPVQDRAVSQSQVTCHLPCRIFANLQRSVSSSLNGRVPGSLESRYFVVPGNLRRCRPPFRGAGSTLVKIESFPVEKALFHMPDQGGVGLKNSEENTAGFSRRQTNMLRKISPHKFNIVLRSAKQTPRQAYLRCVCSHFSA